MTKLSNRKLRNQRPKALFGELIGAGTSLAAAYINKQATEAAARQQAEATARAAQERANDIAEQNRIMTANNEKMIQQQIRMNNLIADANSINQMNAQMQAGNQNEKERMRSARIQVRNGGRKKLRNINASSLRGIGSNLPFTVTDGGEVIPLTVTPEGGELYEIIGDDHNHYHKAKYGTRYKSGVGIKFGNGNIVEGEGNQNTNLGELLYVTPNDAKFISKHYIKGFNPAKAVLAGMNPNDAFNAQETIKDMYGIRDDGKTPVGRNSNRRLRCGGRIKKPLGGNTSYTFGIPKYLWLENYGSKDYDYIKDYNNRNRNNYNDPYRANMIGATISGIGNLASGIFNIIGNSNAANTIISGNEAARQTYANELSKIRGIDLNMLDSSNFRRSHAMAYLTDPNVNINPQLASIERASQRRLSAAGRNSASGAAMLNRFGRIESDAYDAKSNVYGTASNESARRRESNANNLTNVSINNAQSDSKLYTDRAALMLDAMKYNADTRNDVIRDIAGVNYDTTVQNAQIRGNRMQTNLATVGNTLNAIGAGYNNALAANAKMRNQLDMTLLGTTMENQVMYYLDHPNAPGRERLLRVLKNSNNPQYQNWYNELIKG